MTVFHPSIKDQNNISFSVRLDWLNDLKGIITAHDTKGPIYVATPPAFGGEGMNWSPEHLFLGSIASCYMSTYLHFASKMNLKITHLECQAVGQIELVEGKYKFTHIGVFPTIYVDDHTSVELADLAMLKTKKQCLISNSIKADIIYNGKIARASQKAS